MALIRISTDLYVKSTDTHQYLLHTEKFKQRTSELLEFLCKRGHKRQYVQAQINKAFQIPRRDTLYYHSKKNTDRPVFVTTYNPSLPQLNSIIRKYFPTSLLQNVVVKPSKMLHSLLTDAPKTYVIF